MRIRKLASLVFESPKTDNSNIITAKIFENVLLKRKTIPIETNFLLWANVSFSLKPIKNWGQKRADYFAEFFEHDSNSLNHNRSRKNFPAKELKVCPK